jgi:hypothetical protein
LDESPQHSSQAGKAPTALLSQDRGTNAHSHQAPSSSTATWCTTEPYVAQIDSQPTGNSTARHQPEQSTTESSGTPAPESSTSLQLHTGVDSDQQSNDHEPNVSRQHLGIVTAFTGQEDLAVFADRIGDRRAIGAQLPSRHQARQLSRRCAAASATIPIVASSPTRKSFRSGRSGSVAPDRCLAVLSGSSLGR